MAVYLYIMIVLCYISHFTSLSVQQNAYIYNNITTSTKHKLAGNKVTCAFLEDNWNNDYILVTSVTFSSITCDNWIVVVATE